MWIRPSFLDWWNCQYLFILNSVSLCRWDHGGAVSVPPAAVGSDAPAARPAAEPTSVWTFPRTCVCMWSLSAIPYCTSARCIRNHKRTHARSHKNVRNAGPDVDGVMSRRAPLVHSRNGVWSFWLHLMHLLKQGYISACTQRFHTWSSSWKAFFETGMEKPPLIIL